MILISQVPGADTCLSKRKRKREAGFEQFKQRKLQEQRARRARPQGTACPERQQWRKWAHVERNGPTAAARKSETAICNIILTRSIPLTVT
jgi:hypothetical protein